MCDFPPPDKKQRASLNRAADKMSPEIIFAQQKAVGKILNKRALALRLSLFSSRKEKRKSNLQTVLIPPPLFLRFNMKMEGQVIIFHAAYSEIETPFIQYFWVHTKCIEVRLLFSVFSILPRQPVAAFFCLSNPAAALVVSAPYIPWASFAHAQWARDTHNELPLLSSIRNDDVRRAACVWKPFAQIRSPPWRHIVRAAESIKRANWLISHEQITQRGPKRPLVFVGVDRKAAEFFNQAADAGLQLKMSSWPFVAFSFQSGLSSYDTELIV